MKLILQREVLVSRWRVVATLGFSQKRPEIIAILALASELPNGTITPQDVARKLLADRPAVVGERLLRVCNMMRLLEQSEPGGEGWQLSELGRRALTNQEVPTPQRGEFEIWAMEDDLHPEVFLRVKPAELERSQKAGEQPEIGELHPLPVSLGHCHNRIVRPPVRIDQEASEIFVFEFEEMCRRLDGEAGTLTVELTSAGGNARFSVEVEGSREFAPAAKLPTLAEALNSAGRTDIAGPQRITFRTLSDNERRHARREVDLEEFSMPGIGTFSAAKLRDVPLIPSKQEDANQWAVWRLLDQIKGYVWPEQYERLVRSVREFAVKEGWEFDPAIPTQQELARQCDGQTELARKLLVPLDWQALAQPAGSNMPPIVVLSGRAARGMEAEKLIREWGDGSHRVYLMESAESAKSGNGLPDLLSDGIRERAIIRRVRQAPDGWLRVEGNFKTGQRWQPPQKSKPEQKHESTSANVEHAGAWRDLKGIESERLLEDLTNAFWKRPLQELQPEGSWLAVKPR
jgi:hypothetical protein